MHNLEVIIYNLFTFTCHYQGALQSVLGFRDNLQTWLQGRDYCDAVMQEAESIQIRESAVIDAFRRAKLSSAEASGLAIDSDVLKQRIALAVQHLKAGAPPERRVLGQGGEPQGDPHAAAHEVPHAAANHGQVAEDME